MNMFFAIQPSESHSVHDEGEVRTCHYCSPTSDRNLRRISENDLAEAFLTNAPVVPGHTLIIPRRCVSAFDELLPQELMAVFSLLDRIKLALRESFEADGFNYAWNEGNPAGQTVPHFHLHVVPRRIGDAGVLGYDPRQFFYRPGPRDPVHINSLAKTAAAIRSTLEERDVHSS